MVLSSLYIVLCHRSLSQPLNLNLDFLRTNTHYVLSDIALRFFSCPISSGL
jgi:hypothetical protein